jgi:ribonuclease T
MDKAHPISKRFRGFLPVVIDIETGGFNPYNDAILEIAASVITMNDEGKLAPRIPLFFEVEPFAGANLEKSALEFTGIDPFDPERDSVSEEKAFNEVFTHIRQAIKAHDCTRAVLVAHNSAFDHSFINAASERQNIKRNPFHPFTSFDTATLAGVAYGQTVLSKACEAANIHFDSKKAHSALYDTEKTAELFCLIGNQFSIE